MTLYLCVDCGGSKTSVVISSSMGKIIGRALGGPSNFAYLGISLFASAVEATISSALQTCTVPPSASPVPLPPRDNHPQFAVAWLGISGLDSPANIAALTPVLSKMLRIPPGPRLNLAHDTHLLAAPLRLYKDVEYAVAVIAGTGSCVTSFKETEDGAFEEMGRTGGWGWILGDEGGGFHVGREAIRQVLLETDRASLGGPPPVARLPDGKKSLHLKILERFEVENALEILTAAHAAEPTPSSNVDAEPTSEILSMSREKRLSTLSPLVFTSAFEDNDPLAHEVLRITSSGLADQVALVLDRSLGPRAVDASQGIICFGGSLVGIEKYRQLVLDDLARRGHVFRRVEYVADAAAVGAISLTRSGTRTIDPIDIQEQVGSREASISREL